MISGVSLTVGGGGSNPGLLDLLNGEDIQPGSDPSYQLCKTIYLYHPLGGKMTDAPISMAQSQAREITVPNAPEEVTEAFRECWEDLEIDGYIHNTGSLSRVYGLSSAVMGCKGQDPSQPVKMDKIWDQDIYFNVLDPLNTSGSLVLNQIPNAPDFNKPVTVVTNGQRFHSSRFQVLMNESPIYIAFTSSAFGYVGRSVYQRALFPLKTFINSMIVDDAITTKNGLLIAKQKSGGSIIDRMQAAVVNLKRTLLRQAHTGQVASIGIDESIEALNMQNVDGAGTFARNNTLKNIATASDMPAIILENETLVSGSGFGEGSEDAKLIAGFLDGIRRKLKRLYKWFDGIIMYRAWSPAFYSRMQALYPELYRGREYTEVFSEWRRAFRAEWPSLLREPESELVKVDAVKLEALIATLQLLMPKLDPVNMGIAIGWLQDTISENKRLFPYGLELDIDALVASAEEDKERMNDMQDQAAAGGEEGEKKFPKFDSASQPVILANLRQKLDQLRPVAAR